MRNSTMSILMGTILIFISICSIVLSLLSIIFNGWILFGFIFIPVGIFFLWIGISWRMDKGKPKKYFLKTGWDEKMFRRDIKEGLLEETRKGYYKIKDEEYT